MSGKVGLEPTNQKTTKPTTADIYNLNNLPTD